MIEKTCGTLSAATAAFRTALLILLLTAAPGIAAPQPPGATVRDGCGALYRHLEAVSARLSQLPSEGLPFLLEERGQRIRALEAILSETEVTCAQKCRQVLEALRVEAEYGHSVEAYRDKIQPSPAGTPPIMADILRVGRLALFWQTPDGNTVGHWNPDTGTWAQLPAHYRKHVNAAMDMAHKHRAVDLVTLPMGKLIRPASAPPFPDSTSNAAAPQTHTQASPAREVPEEAGACALADAVREAGDNTTKLLRSSHFTALNPKRTASLEKLLSPHHSPGLEAVTAISRLLFEEISLSSSTRLYTAAFITPSGVARTATILTVGPFCAAFRDDDQVGFLRYGKETKRFYAIEKEVPRSIGRLLKQYINGNADAVIFDMHRGAALEGFAHHRTLHDRILAGGPMVWPILLIGVMSLAIAVERTLVLNRIHANTDTLMGRVNNLAAQGNWSGCEAALVHGKGRPVNNVLRAGLGAVNERREVLESILEEAILRELPRLERFLPALKIMGAVAPLLGLLGTVTGMIATFEVITRHGTGDPRLMSGGISEALITTMLGLSVAIPIMLLHTFLHRRVEHIVGDMEEKAVAMCNIICRVCTRPETENPGGRPAVITG